MATRQLKLACTKAFNVDDSSKHPLLATVKLLRHQKTCRSTDSPDFDKHSSIGQNECTEYIPGLAAISKPQVVTVIE